MSVKLTVTSNEKKFRRSLTALERKQLPFAYSKTLNDTMKAVKKFTVARTFPKSFDVRNRKFFEAAMFGAKSIVWAKKTNLEVVATDRFDRGNLLEHALGGAKKVRGRTAVPTAFTKTKRGARGVRANFRPKAVVASEKGYRQGNLIYQRFGPRGSKRRVLYVLSSKATLPKRFPFFEDATRITRKTGAKLFARNFDKAVKTAFRPVR